MIKDIQSNYILLKNKKNKKYKDYFLFRKMELEKNSFKDFNDKLGIKKIYIKNDKLFNKNKTFMNGNLNFFRFSNYFTFSSFSKDSFSNKKNKLTIN